MKKGVTTYYSLLAIGSLLLIGLLQGCSMGTPEEVEISTPTEETEVLCISTRAEGESTEETDIRTLRLFIFSEEDGKMVLNQLFMTNKATGEIPSNSYTYFARIGNEYKIGVMIPKGVIRVVLIANELSSLEGKDYTLKGVQQVPVEFFETYQESGAMNIKLTPIPDSNKGYIPMYAESKLLYYPDWNGHGKVVAMNLTRTLAKVSIQIGGLELDSTEKGTLSINSAGIINVTQRVILGDSVTSYNGPLVRTITKKFEPEVTSTSLDKKSNELLFYIPGHVVSEERATQKQYTYLQINASYTPKDGSPINSTYQIPLGNGIQEWYEAGAKAPLTAADLKVSRNKYYKVVAKVKTTGEQAVVSIEATVEEWDSQDVNGDIDPPCLNVSSINWTYNAGGTNRIYFWSNMDKEKIKLDPKVDITKGGNPEKDVSIENVFKELTFASSGDAVPANFHFYENPGESLYFRTNGYFDLETIEGYSGSKETITLRFTAGKVKRTISVVLP